MSQSQLCQTREEERFLALGQWLDLYRKDNAVSVVRKNIELTRQLIAQIKDRQQQGLALKNDITRYELQLQQLQLRLTQLENERLIANHSLNNTLGLNVQTRVECDSSVVSQTFGREAESVWQLAAAESPRMQQARLAADMARQDVRLAKAALLPKVSVFAIDDFNGPITYGLPPINKNINVWAVGIGVSYPISGLFKNNHQLRQARKAEAAAQSRLDAAARHTDNAMQQAHTLYLQSYVELATQQKNVELARQNYEVVSERYLNQLALITDMLDASNSRLDAELSEVDARINIAYAYYKMKFIAGTL